MKKILSLLILPLIALSCLFGCKGDKTPADIEALYKNMVASYVVEEKNQFFANPDATFTISIAYNTAIQEQITNATPITDLQKRYVALGYQQKVLNNIFNYYEKNQAEFYKAMTSAEYKQVEIDDLYASLDNLNNTLKTFKEQYTQFMTDVEGGDIMVFSILSYTYQLNRVIDSSFDFIYEFIDVYNKYCVENDNVTAANLNRQIDEAYVDIANIVYITNLKTFNYSVGEKGVCDLLPLVSSPDNTYNYLNYLDNTKVLSSSIVDNLVSGAEHYDATKNKINDFSYARELMSQRSATYKTIMTSIDDYTLNQYRFKLVNGVDYDTYISSLSASDRANVQSLNNYINDIFKPFNEKLSLIVA